MQGITHAALSHEFTHFVEELSAEKFRKFTDVLFDVLGKSDVDVNRLIEAKEAVLRNTEEYKGRSEKELRAIAYSEAVAEMMEPVLTDTDAISRISQKIKQQDRSLWEKIKDFIKGIVEKLKAAYRDMEPDSAIARLTRETVTNSEAVLDAFSEAAADAVLNYNLQKGQKNSAREGVAGNGVRYSSRNLSEQIDEIANQTFDRNNHVNYGSTPRALSNILSLPILPMLGTYTHAYTMALSQQQAQEEGRKTRGLNFHDLGWDMVKNIPDMLNHPAAIIKSNTDVNDSRFVVVTNQVDKNGNPIIAAIAPKGTGQYYSLDVPGSILLSGYGKDSFSNYLNRAKTENRVLWVDKNNHQKQASPGVQFPNALLSGDYSNNLAQFKKIVKGEFVGTIFQNTFDNDGNRRFSSRDSEYLNLAQNPEENREALSRMVENAAREAGYTRLFFHGSKNGGGFTVFRDWQYFTENREYAKRYANRENPGSLYETYVKMENPFDTRIPEVRELFEQARQEYGMGELQENGLPDWTDGYDIADYIDENDLPYDGIILDEGGDMVNGKPVSRGLSYVIRDSSQVKSADAVTYDDNGNVIPLSQRFDTGKEDIRYSARNPQAQVEAENERLKSDVKRQIAEAVREYRRQQDVQSKAYRQMYERQLEEVKKEYEKFRSQAESLSSESTMRYQNEFYNALMGTENLGKAKIPELRKKFRELAVENSGKDMDARKARQTEYTRLLDEFLTSRDIGKLRTTIQEQRDRAKAKVEAARVTEQRGKLYRAVNEINRRLLNPTKTLYVPDSLAPAVTKFMQGLTEAMESPKNSWNVQGALETLQEQYRKLTQMNEGVFTQEYNEGILDLLDNAISAVGGTDFNKLSASQIEDVYSAVRSVLTAIRNENKMFAANLNKTYAEAAEAVRREEAALPNRKPTTGAVQDKAEKFGWNQLKPVYAMMRLGSDTLLKQYNNLRAGEDKWQRTIAAARAYGLGIMAKYHYDQWNDSLMKLDTETGTVELSLEERMSLYAYARREQAFEHLTKGGFVLSDENTRTVKNRFGIKTEQT